MGDTITASDTISDRTFSRFSAFIQSELGIKMPDVKKTMLQARLQKRLRKLGMKTFDEYYDYVFSPAGMEAELPNMIDVVTTNKTDFFREPGHFEYLIRTAVPELTRTRTGAARNRVRLWSAACSTGEEPYTLAMVLMEFAESHHGFHFSILATDISTRVLEGASLGIYEEGHAEPIPLTLRKKYLLRSKDKSKGLVRIIPDLRAVVTFRRLNLMDEDFEMRDPMDIIFCRNVIIYFDRPTQAEVLNRLCRYLIPGGYLFMGHSETLNGLKVPLVPAAPTVYRKTL